MTKLTGTGTKQIMTKKTNDEIILTNRDEISGLVGRELTDKEWSDIQEKLMSDDDMWQIFDDTISTIIEDM